MIYTEQSGSRPTEIFRASSTGGAGVALTHLNDALLASSDAHAARRNVGRERRQDARPCVHREAARFFGIAKISGAVSDSRRTARRVGRDVDLSLERAGVRVGRISGRDAESARVHRLRPEIHRRHQWRLGRQSLRRHHGGGRSRGRAALRRSRSHGGGRRILRRLHGRLDARPHHALQGDGLARRRLRSAQHGRRDRRAVVPAVGVSTACPGTIRICTRSGRPVTS